MLYYTTVLTILTYTAMLCYTLYYVLSNFLVLWCIEFLVDLPFLHIEIIFRTYCMSRWLHRHLLCVSFWGGMLVRVSAWISLGLCWMYAFWCCCASPGALGGNCTRPWNHMCHTHIYLYGPCVPIQQIWTSWSHKSCIWARDLIYPMRARPWSHK